MIIAKTMVKDRSDVLVILGSAREESNTLKTIEKRTHLLRYDLIDLQKKKIVSYSYDPKQLEGDDFHSVAVEMLNYETIIFATPVYWYSMSGQMKIFFDRLTELTDRYKSIGKALKGKKTHLIACGASPTLPEGFEIPFKLTSEYFDMEYVSCHYEQIR